MAGVDRVVAGAAAHGLLQRAVIAAMRRFDDSVVIEVAADQVVGDEFQPLDALGQPCAVAGGLDVVPGGNQQTGIRVEHVPVVPVRDDFARRARAVVEPPIDRAADEIRQVNVRRELGRQEYMVRPNVDQTTHRVADDVVGQNACRGAEGIALVAPFRGRLNRIEPASPGRRPHRFVLQVGRRGKTQGLHRQRDRLAGVQRRQFEREVDRMVRPASAQPALERARVAGKQHLPKIRRTDDRRQSQAAVRLPTGGQERGRRHERIERKDQFQLVHVVLPADELHGQPAARGSNRPVDARPRGGQSKPHFVRSLFFAFAGQIDRRLRRALLQRYAGSQQVALRAIAAFGVPTQQRQCGRLAIGLDAQHGLARGGRVPECNDGRRRGLSWPAPADPLQRPSWTRTRSDRPTRRINRF